MDLDERLRNVAVVGAAGKMGRGIALLLAREALRIIARESSGREGAEGASGTPRLSLIDPARAAHHGLVEYIMRHTVAQALGDAPGDDGPRDGDREREALERLLSLSTDLDGARGAKLVFEAAPENLRLKADLLRDLRGLCPEDAIFLTNTSSIPIHVLEEESGLRGRIIGFHFYNPPAVQRLLELITTDSTPSEIDELGVRLAERLGKLVVRSADVAGFIGNGHFIREGAYALARAREIADGGLGFEGAVRAIDIVTREALLRPMGIFQLIDYVGIDVFAAIADVMSDHLEGEDLRHPLLDRMLASRRRGGQDPTGAQTDGFLRYEDGRPTGVFSLADEAYRPLAEIDPRVRERLGDLPDAPQWRTLRKDSERDEKIARHFAGLEASRAPGARLALEYLERSREIAAELVRSGVASAGADVDRVLVEGFHHLYGPLSIPGWSE